MRKHQAGFSIIEVLVAGGVIAIITAIAIVSYTNAQHRAKQKRTVNDIRAIGHAWEQRATETQSYAVAGYTFPVSGMIPADSLIAALRPTYLRDVPVLDGWRRPLQFAVQPGEDGSAGTYGIRSAGRDGTFDSTTYAGGLTTDPDCDIVWSAGQFVSYPDSVQSH